VVDTSDLRRFLRRLLRQVPRSPDVLLLQEIWGYSAGQVAHLLNKRTSAPYRIAVNAGDPPWRQPDAQHVVGTDSAILFNARTMSAARSGYIKLGYKASKAAPGTEVRVKRHPFALLRSRRGSFSLPVISVHFSRVVRFRSQQAEARAKSRFVRVIHRRMGRMFDREAPRKARVIAGDFNIPKCKRTGPGCELTPVYRIATRRFGYRDAVTVMNGWTNAIDFIFSKAPVVKSGIDRTKHKKGKKRYSDHVFRWALVEKKDRTAPSDPGRISFLKGNRDEVRLRGWKKARDGGTGFSHFDVRRSRKGPDGRFRDVGNTKKTMFRDRKVRPGVKYWYVVIAYDRKNNRSRASRVVAVRAGEPPRDRRRQSRGSSKGPNLDGPMVPKIDRPTITGPHVDAPAIDRPNFDPPPSPLISGPQQDPPKPTPYVEPPPIKP
jgi:endonuclease/exonuclease/phosphatase family metal-dependent hydrolase